MSGSIGFFSSKHTLQYVSIKEHESDLLNVLRGVPQWFIFRLVLFALNDPSGHLVNICRCFVDVHPVDLINLLLCQKRRQTDSPMLLVNTVSSCISQYALFSSSVVLNEFVTHKAIYFISVDRISKN